MHDAGEALVEAGLEEEPPAEGEERPHEHGVVEGDGGSGALWRPVAPLSGIVHSIRAVEHLFISVVTRLEDGDVGEVSLLEGEKAKTSSGVPNPSAT